MIIYYSLPFAIHLPETINRFLIVMSLFNSISLLFEGTPNLIHYGLLFEIENYKFDKHWYGKFCRGHKIHEKYVKHVGIYLDDLRIEST